MGINTDFIGCVTIKPPLNDAEQQYLAAFAASRRFARPGGSYAVPFNPAAPENADDVEGSYRVAVGQPSFWCQWMPAWDGYALAHDGGEKFYGATRWLQYLIEHFLMPDAIAATSGLTWFDDFTFDHHLSGAVAAYSHGDGELYLIRCKDNVVTQQLLDGAALPHIDPPPLPYQEVNASDRERRVRRRRPDQHRD